MLTMMMMMNQSDRAERRAASDRLMQLLGLALPALLPLFKKEADPVLAAILPTLLNGGTGNAKQMEQMLQLQAKQAELAMEQQQKSLLSIMELNNKMNQEAITRAQEERDDGSDTGSPLAAILKEVRLGLPLLGALNPPKEQAPAQAPAIAAPEQAPASSNPNQPRVQPVVAILRQLRILYEKRTPKPALVRSAVVLVALQDEGLTRILSDPDMGADEVIAYCIPYVQQDAELLKWVQTKDDAGKMVVADFLNTYVENYLIPMVEQALDIPDEEEPKGNEPEVLSAEAAKE